MQIDIITIFPNMFKEVFEWGIISQGVKEGVVDINIINLRDYTHDRHKQVDDRPLGGGVGMVLKPEPLFEAVNDLKNKFKNKSKKNSYIIFLTPQGKTLNQTVVENLSKKDHLILICGRYEGIDQRVRDYLVDAEISIGDFVLSGGEFPAMVLTDAIVRLIPGVIKNKDFNESESFSNPTDRNQLDYPQYTRPADYNGIKVPDILLSGNHKEIKKWRESNRKKK